MNILETIKEAFGVNAQKKKVEEVNYLEGETMRQALTQLQQNEAEKARELFVQETTEHPDNGYALYYLAMLDCNAEHYGTALQSINDAIRRLQREDNWLAACFYHRARIYQGLGKEAEMLADLEESIRLRPDVDTPYDMRARHFYQKKEYDKASIDFQHLADMQPGNPYPVSALALIARKQGKYDESIERYEYALKLDPTYYEASVGMAEALLFKPDCEASIKQYIHALQLNNGDSRAEMPLISLMPASLQPQVIAAIQSKCQEESNNAYWPYLMGRYYCEQQQSSEAVQWYEESIKRNGTEVALTELAHVHFLLSDFDKALFFADKALRVNPAYEKAHAVSVHVLMELNLFEKALEKLDTYLSMMGENADVHQLKSDCLRFLGRHEEALTEVQKALELNPSKPIFYYMYAKVMHDLGNYDAEREYLEQTLKMLEAESEGQYSSLRVGCLLMLDRVNEALDVLGLADERTKHHWDYSLNQAVTFAKSGRIEEAQAALQQAFDRGCCRFHELEHAPLMQVLHELPGFDAIIEREGNRYHARLAEAALREESEYESGLASFTRDAAGLIYMQGRVNDLPLRFVFDTGASDISISSVEAAFMLKNGYLEERDLGGVQHYRTASGEFIDGTVINLRNVELGGVIFHDLRAAIIHNQEAPLLLGQSFLLRIMTYSIDEKQKHFFFITHCPSFDPYDLQCLAYWAVNEEHDNAKAAMALNKLYELTSSYSACYQAGYYYLLAADTDKVIELCSSHLTAYGNTLTEEQHMNLLCLKISALTFGQRYDEAAELFQQLDSKPDGLSGMLGIYGFVLRQLNRLDEAESVLLRSDKSDDLYAYECLLLAEVYRVQGKKDEAQTVLEQMVTLPVIPTNVTYIAEALRLLGRDEECRELLAQGFEMMEQIDDEFNLCTYFLNIATNRAALGDLVESEQALQRSVEISPVVLRSIAGLEDYEHLKLLPSFPRYEAAYVKRIV